MNKQLLINFDDGIRAETDRIIGRALAFVIAAAVKTLRSIPVLYGLVVYPVWADETHPAPDCALTRLHDGAGLNLSDYRGQVVYVDFWASWCGPCAKSFPFMNRLNADYAGKDFTILAVNLDEDADDAEAFLERFPAEFPVVADNASRCAQAFQVKAMPSTFLVDKDGHIRMTHLGFRAGETDSLKAMIDSLLAERN